MARKPLGLAPDLMTTEALWDLLYGDAIQLDIAAEIGMPREERKMRSHRVLVVVRELRLRGIQLSFHWE